MAKPDKAKYQYFYILNVKLRNKNSKKDLDVEAYEKLFRRLWRKKVHKESSPQKHCIIKSCREEKDDKGNFLYFSGLLAQFTYIGNENWFNTDSLEAVEDLKLPENTFPDLVLTDYVFVPSAHRLIFQTSASIAISPYPVRKFLEKALDSVLEQHEIVSVDVETSQDGIQQIREAKEIRWISMSVNYSNMDTTGDMQKFIEDNLRDSNTKSMDIKAKAKDGSSIDINQSKILKGALDTVQSNGEAEAKIVTKDGKLTKVKTEDYPRKERVFGVVARFPDLAHEAIMKIFRGK